MSHTGGYRGRLDENDRRLSGFQPPKTEPHLTMIGKNSTLRGNASMHSRFYTSWGELLIGY